MNLYNQVNRNCSSRLPEIKKEEISEDEKIGQKRSCKEEISRIVSSKMIGGNGNGNGHGGENGEIFFLKRRIWRRHENCLNSYDIINFYGFTKNPDILNYMVVMDYANKGNLRRNLTKIMKISWKQKLHMLLEIISGLYEIHKQNLIHCDFHDGNILNHEDEKDEKDEENKKDKVCISDLGLCRPVNPYLKKHDIYGVMSFMAPEILRGKPYTEASDVYSFSMIMWEFTSGVPPFNNRAHDIHLSLSICKGERPEIIENTPQCYVDLMEKCWDENPLKRPSSKKVLNIVEKWIFLPDGTKIKDIDEELKCNILKQMKIN
ncbi:kinase-like domain-containing protein [Rhizophagus diaphanus]|nr:kinase-like domain-containing protein [Rhizophagus diaphanus] [Rhizophagus sp. MUCL 43196]